MKKILVVSSVYPPEPVISAKVSFDIARKLAESNRVTVICPHPSRPLGYEFDKIVDEEKIERKMCIRDSSCAFYVFKRIIGRIYIVNYSLFLFV